MYLNKLGLDTSTMARSPGSYNIVDGGIQSAIGLMQGSDSAITARMNANDNSANQSGRLVTSSTSPTSKVAAGGDPTSIETYVATTDSMGRQTAHDTAAGETKGGSAERMTLADMLDIEKHRSHGPVTTYP